MLTTDSLSMKDFVVENRGLFEQCAREYKYATKYREKQYTQLNYRFILKEMVDFINGYIEYKEKDSNKYSGKVLGTAKSFYDAMFENKKKYRKKLYLPEIKDSYADFLRGTKDLQTLMESNVDRANRDPEFRMLLTMTDNQYRKLSKVCRDDMQIYRRPGIKLNVFQRVLPQPAPHGVAAGMDTEDAEGRCRDGVDQPVRPDPQVPEEQEEGCACAHCQQRIAVRHRHIVIGLSDPCADP